MEEHNNNHSEQTQEHTQDIPKNKYLVIADKYLHGAKFKWLLIITAMIGLIGGYAFTKTLFIKFDTSNTVSQSPPGSRKAKAAIEAASAPAKYVVYVGQLSDKNMIDKLSLELKSHGYPNQIVSRNNAYTINMGEYVDKAKAASVSAELESMGYPAFIDSTQ